MDGVFALTYYSSTDAQHVSGLLERRCREPPQCRVDGRQVPHRQTFTKALDEVRKKERREKRHPKAFRWAVFKRLDKVNLTAKQVAALQEPVADHAHAATVMRLTPSR